MEFVGQRRARRRSVQSGTRYRLNQRRGWQEPGYKDDLGNHTGGGGVQGGGHCQAWPNLHHRQQQVLLSAEREEFMRPTGHHDQRCVDTYPGQCCVGEPWGGEHPLWTLYTLTSDAM
jgi:hypothetical protein